jgi:phosphoglycerol transferase MdoB-like AlkP superfamily enzyme
MSTKKKRKAFPIGLMLFVLALAIYKAAMLSVSMTLDWRSFLFLVGLDAFYLSILLLAGIFLGYAGSRPLRTALWLLLVFMTVTYLVDSFVLLALNEHAPLFDMGRYALEPRVVLSFFDIRAYTAIVLLLIAMRVKMVYDRETRKQSFIVLLVAVLTGIFCSAYAPLPLARYAMLSPMVIWDGATSREVSTDYSEEEIAFYATQDDEDVYIPESNPNIILLVVESLSSINSKRVSGVDGFLDGFDVLTDEGLLFQNFFANHQASEGGLIALLGGYPPIHFPTATPYMFDEFANQPSIIAQYRHQGYFTEFLTNAQLEFIGLNRYLDGLGIHRSRGRDEVESMKNAPVIVQDAPSDVYLFDEAVKTVDQLSSGQQPFFLTIATTSTHLPYRHPEQGADTQEAVWEWSMQQVTRFYSQLSKMGYFKDGILLITGDHRQMRPLSETEIARYGDSARARVPLLVIGREYTAGGIDERFFQQSDLLRMLDKIKQSEASLSPQPVWVERYNRKYGRAELIDTLGVFDEADSGRHEYRLKAPGNRIEWIGEKPAFALRVETRIHVQRSQHQKFRASRK